MVRVARVVPVVQARRRPIHVRASDQVKARTKSPDKESAEREAPVRPSAGTPDIERGSGGAERDGTSANDSLVGDPTGAFKERP
jgi:hypothetical protein